LIGVVPFKELFFGEVQYTFSAPIPVASGAVYSAIVAAYTDGLGVLRDIFMVQEKPIGCGADMPQKSRPLVGTQRLDPGVYLVHRCTP
jgi:hypothetical protein